MFSSSKSTKKRARSEAKREVKKQNKIARSLNDAVAASNSTNVQGGMERTTGEKEGGMKKKKKNYKEKGADFKGKKKPNPMSSKVDMTVVKDKGRQLKISRQSSKPHFSLVEELKKAWNVVRQRDTGSAKRSELVANMATQIKGRVLDVTLRHDASRIVQSIFQFGSKQHRSEVLDELLSKVVELGKSSYGHFVILKALAVCDSGPEQKKISAAMQGHFLSLGTNVIGAPANQPQQNATTHLSQNGNSGRTRFSIEQQCQQQL